MEAAFQGEMTGLIKVQGSTVVTKMKPEPAVAGYWCVQSKDAVAAAQMKAVAVAAVAVVAAAAVVVAVAVVAVAVAVVVAAVAAQMKAAAVVAG